MQTMPALSVVQQEEVDVGCLQIAQARLELLGRLLASKVARVQLGGEKDVLALYCWGCNAWWQQAAPMEDTDIQTVPASVALKTPGQC